VTDNEGTSMSMGVGGRDKAIGLKRKKVFGTDIKICLLR